MGVIGLGAIGVMVANAAVTLGMQVSGYDPFISIEAAWGIVQQCEKSTNSGNSYCSIRLHHFTRPLTDKTKV
jgi:D-3-phosphoglycerate dehydrogenase